MVDDPNLAQLSTRCARAAKHTRARGARGHARARLGDARTPREPARASRAQSRRVARGARRRRPPRRSAAARRDAPASGTTARGGLTATELARAAWHAFPGFLALFLVREVFPDESHRTWRARVVARALAPFLVAVWLVEWARLDHEHILPSVARRAFAAILRPSEQHAVHGTAWYLLGVCIALAAYPADAAVLAVAHLAWCDPAASVVGRALGDASWLGGGKRFAGGKSFIGTFACAATGAAVTYALFAPGGTFAAREIAVAATTTSVRRGIAFIRGDRLSKLDGSDSTGRARGRGRTHDRARGTVRRVPRREEGIRRARRVRSRRSLRRGER